jgi:ketosteroid isomerase-like protein
VGDLTDDRSSVHRLFTPGSVAVSCTVHQWSHSTEPCPYCREIGADSQPARPRAVHHESHAAHESQRVVRSDRLARAIVDAISGDVSRVEELFTQDVVGSGPAISVSSREELAIDIEEREGTFTDVEVAIAPLDVGGSQACVEWVATAVHSGPLVLDESRTGVLIPTGRRFRVRAVTVAEFEGDRICSFRSYWDDLPILQDLREPQLR